MSPVIFGWNDSTYFGVEEKTVTPRKINMEPEIQSIINMASMIILGGEPTYKAIYI